MANIDPELPRRFRALADPTRLSILNRLSRGPASLSELAEPYGMALPTIFQHVKLLEEAELVRSRKQGRVRHFALNPRALDVTAAWLAEQASQWEARFDRVDALAMSLGERKAEK